MQPKNAKQLVAEIKAYMSESCIKQIELSDCSKIHQATLSKYLRKPPRRVTPALQKVCNYADISLYTDTPNQPEKNQVLMKALRDNWDGTDEHARKISKIIHAVEN